MSATGRHDDGESAASDVAARLADASFVRLLSAADGDAIAATGLLARALDETPFHVSVPDPLDAPTVDGDDLTVAVGRSVPGAVCTLAATSTPASETAVAVSRELDAEPDVPLALAGALAARSVGGRVGEAATALDRRPGVAVPIDDLADGLAHSTLLHASFSGDPETTRGLLSDVDGDTEAAHRTVASLVALETVGAADASERSATAVERALRPHLGGPFGTVGGYADVLDVVAREAPGTAVALALGHDATDAALASWRARASRAHEGLRTASTGRYKGLFVVRDEAGDLPAETVARLAADFRSPEPVVLALAEGYAAATATVDRDLTDPMATVASELDGTAAPTATGAVARFDGDTAEFALRFREAL
jgi:hypothetical protein